MLAWLCPDRSFLMILLRRAVTEPRGAGVFDNVNSSPRCNHLSLLSPSPCLCPRQVYSTNACVVLSFSLFYYFVYSSLFLYLHTPKSKRAMKSPQRHFPSLSFDSYPASHQEPYLKPLNPPPFAVPLGLLGLLSAFVIPITRGHNAFSLPWPSQSSQ